MANLTLVTKHETYHDCYLIVDSYLADSSLVLEIWNDEYGPIARITTCLHRLTVHEDEACNCFDDGIAQGIEIGKSTAINKICDWLEAIVNAPEPEEIPF